MNNIGSMGATALPLITSFLLIGATSTVMFDKTDNISYDAEKILKDTLEEITTYLKIDDVIGKYYRTDEVNRVEKIVLMVKPLYESIIIVSEITIKISNKDDVTILYYSGHAAESDSKTIFENQIWEKTNNTFSLIVILDRDRSILEHGIINKDTAFIAIKLPEEFIMKNSESIKISIIPAKGITTSVTLETPSIHLTSIINFEEI